MSTLKIEYDKVVILSFSPKYVNNVMINNGENCV